ncbi:MAG: DEAD/DEAH box helicase [Propionibacteriaceae bacterium]|nr:DEAD/DEAH box helicase [Propionibacteriaceae bacterium]
MLDDNQISDLPNLDSEPRSQAADADNGASFGSLGLPDNLLTTLDDLGFVEATPIQVATIPPLLDGADIVGVAQTGTGKTAAFGLPMLAKIDPEQKEPQGLVLAPTRELALQVAHALQDLAKGLDRVRITAIYGGAPYLPQKRALQAGTHIVVGTPGRMIDHMERGTLDLGTIKFVVLDEGDEMLRMGFAEEVDKILSQVPDSRQIALFSATMPPEIRRTVDAHLHNPRQIAVSRQSSTVASVEQRYAIVPQRHKAAALARVLATSTAEAALVFVQTKAAAEEVGASLIERGIAASVISGDVPQTEREKVVERLRSGQLDVVVATDVAARGLDVERIGLVVNLDLPRETESYVHRIGRTGRAGRTGIALSFVTPKERDRLRRIEKAVRAQLVAVNIPTPGEVNAHRVEALLERVPEQLASGIPRRLRRAVEEFLDQSDESRFGVAVDGRDPESVIRADDVDPVMASETGSETEGETPWYAVADEQATDAAGRDVQGDDRGDRTETGEDPEPIDIAWPDGPGLPDEAAVIDEIRGLALTAARERAEQAVELATALVALAIDQRGSTSLADDDMDEELARLAQRGDRDRDRDRGRQRPARDRDHRDYGRRDRPSRDRAGRDGERRNQRGSDWSRESYAGERAPQGRGGHERSYDHRRDHETAGHSERDNGRRDWASEHDSQREPYRRDWRSPDDSQGERAANRGGHRPVSAGQRRRDGHVDGPDDRRGRKAGKQSGYNRYWIGVGRRHGVRPGAIVGALTNEGGLQGRDLGRVDMFAGFSIVEIGPRLNRQTLQHLARTVVAGQPLRIRPDASASTN